VFTVFDWILIIVFALAAIWGFRKGLVNACLLAISIYVALLISGQFAAQIINFLWEDAENQSFSVAIGYVLVFVGVFIVGRIASRVIKAGLERLEIKWIDPWGGLILGSLVGILLSASTIAILARYTYVTEEYSISNESKNASGEERIQFDREALIRQLTRTAETFIAGSTRQYIDDLLIESKVVGILIDVKSLLSDSTLGLYPEEFGLAIDILETKRGD